MQFSRPSRPGLAPGLSTDGQAEADAGLPGLPQPKDGAEGKPGEAGHAALQAAFRLGPNVRFTRTPESLMARKAVREDAAESTTPAVAAEAPADDPVAGLNLVAAQMRDQAPAEAVPAFRKMPSLPPLIVPPRQPAVARNAATAPVAARAPVISQPPLPVAVAPRALPAISDHAFWEVMPFDLDMPLDMPRAQGVRIAPAPVPALPVAPISAAPVARAQMERTPAERSGGVSVTALYREVRGRDSVPPPVAMAAASVDVAAAEPVAPEPVLPALAEPVVVEAVAEESRPAPVVQRAPAPARQRPGSVRAPEAEYEFPPVNLLQQPQGERGQSMQPDALQQSAGLLESVLEDFGIRGEIIDVRPGPVVTLYEFEPAPGVKSSRVIGLSDDIARSMSALSARVAVVPGRNVIGIELPNATRETVYFRELIECEDYWETRHRLALCLGKTIGGEPVITELAKMPHLLVAGTTGSGKSVAINTMILSLLYRLRPDECRLIMIDPKMLELSVYDGIPHLLTPVVIDPRKAVLALKWAVREMEERYRKMSRLGVRNIDGYNSRAAQARAAGEKITVSVQAGFDRGSGEIIYEDQELDLSPMPYIVVIVDEMADLMMVAGKDIEGAIQRLAQMARAAGIHLIMATQRPSVDVITGTIKANFPTRISFQVTSKIDSRTILGEQGAEHLLGQGDMLHMAGGGRISRVHGPFVSDAEVEAVVRHLKAQGRPDYLGSVTEDEEDGGGDEAVSGDEAVFDKSAMGAGGDDSDELYAKAVKVVLKDRKCSTSYIQRRLSIGYNRAASLVERMENEGLVGPANHVGKREIISGGRSEPGFSEDYSD